MYGNLIFPFDEKNFPKLFISIIKALVGEILCILLTALFEKGSEKFHTFDLQLCRHYFASG